MADGTTNWPADAAGQTALGIDIAGTKYYFQGDNSTAKNLKVAFFDAAGNALLTTGNPGFVAARLGTDGLYAGVTLLTPKFAKIAASSSGNNTLVAAVSSKKIRVLAYNLIANAAVNAKFQDGASGTDLTGLKYFSGQGDGICADFTPVGWFETSATTLLNLNLSGAVAVGGELVYVEV